MDLFRYSKYFPFNENDLVNILNNNKCTLCKKTFPYYCFNIFFYDKKYYAVSVIYNSKIISCNILLCTFCFMTNIIFLYGIKTCV